MEIAVVFIIIILFIFLNSLIYIAGAWATPAGSVYLGTVQWPPDYFYYLSQFAQGKESWFAGYDLYTGDFGQQTYVGWVNVFLGHVFYMIGVNQIMAYQLSVIIFSITYLVISYLLIREVFPDESSSSNPESQTKRLQIFRIPDFLHLGGVLRKFSKAYSLRVLPLVIHSFPGNATQMNKASIHDGEISYSWKRIITFLFFVSSNAFPKINIAGGKIDFSFYDYWFNNGLPFNRLGGVPHHLIGRTAVALALLLGIWWGKRKIKNKKSKIKNQLGIIFGLIITGFVLASVEPVHWILVTVTLFIMGILDPMVSLTTGFIDCKIKMQNAKGKITNKNSKLYIRKFLPPTSYLLLPPFFFFLGGFPMALYLKKMFSFPPYSQLAVWEAGQQVRISFVNFLLANGPVAVWGISGAIISFLILAGLRYRIFQTLHPHRDSVFPATKYPLIEKHDHLCIEPRFSKLISSDLPIIFTSVSLFLFFSPIPGWVGIVNVRFIPAVVTLFFSCLAVEAINRISNIYYNKKKIVNLVLVSLTLAVIIPTYIRQIQIRVVTNRGNSLYYLHQNTVTAFKKAEDVSGVESRFLIPWPLNVSFPALSGRRVYEGHNLLTIDEGRKSREASDFFNGKIGEKDAEAFLKRNKITYVADYSNNTNINTLLYLDKIFKNDLITVYKVK